MVNLERRLIFTDFPEKKQREGTLNTERATAFAYLQEKGIQKFQKAHLKVLLNRLACRKIACIAIVTAKEAKTDNTCFLDLNTNSH